MKVLLALLAMFFSRLLNLPTPGSDVDAWGPELNNWLLVSHNADGSIKDSALGKVSFNVQTASYTIANADAGKLISINSANATNLTIPLDASTSGGAIATGTMIMIRQGSAGQITVVPASGVSLNSRGGLTRIAGQYGYATLIKLDVNIWELMGDIA